MPTTLWTNALEPQRKLLLHSVARLLSLETSLRRGKLPVSLEDLDRRLSLIAAIAASIKLGTPWPAELEGFTSTPLLHAHMAQVRARLERLPPESENGVHG